MHELRLRRPVLEDGPELHRLIKRCPPLDENSRYCNLLQATHFSDTSVVAERDGALIGFVTGYRIPERQRDLFVWQVGVSPDGRGEGLAQRMLTALLDRLDTVSHLETTVTPDNGPSRALFEGLARRLGAPLERSVLFRGEPHFDGRHADEILYRIGPLPATGQDHD